MTHPGPARGTSDLEASVSSSEEGTVEGKDQVRAGLAAARRCKAETMSPAVGDRQARLHHAAVPLWEGGPGMRSLPLGRGICEDPQALGGPQ